jgi:hypothetical protein
MKYLLYRYEQLNCPELIFGLVNSYDITWIDLPNHKNWQGNTHRDSRYQQPKNKDLVSFELNSIIYNQVMSSSNDTDNSCAAKKNQHNFLLFQLCDHLMIFVILEPWVGNECVVMLTLVKIFSSLSNQPIIDVHPTLKHNTCTDPITLAYIASDNTTLFGTELHNKIVYEYMFAW